MRQSCLAFFVLLTALLLSRPASAQTVDEKRFIDSVVHIADSMGKAMNLPDSIVIITGDTSQKSAIDTNRLVGSNPDGTASDTTTNNPTAEAAQGDYEISGVVKDKNTGEGIPFATVFFPGSDVGTPADLDGKFSLPFKKPPSDTLRVTAIGYATWNRRINLSGDHRPVVEIELTREVAQLSEFVFHAGEDPALALLKNILAKKGLNNPDRHENYKYEVYNKLEVDIRNLSRKQFESLPVPMIKKFGFIYNNLDSTSEKTPFLPFFLTETLSDYYYQRTPKKVREFIRATNIKGIKNESVDKFLGSAYQNVNAYDNFIPVFDKSFVSPISYNAAFYYKYRIKDTQEAYGHPIVLVEFRPRRDGENCFFGDFWVVLDSIYAIQRISMEVPKNANINFVSRVSLYQESAPVYDSLWYTVKDKFVSDFNLPYSPKLPGFIGRKTTTYRNMLVNSDSVTNVLNNKDYHKDVIVADTARSLSEDFWNSVRPDTLSKNERAIYSMVDTLNNLPVFQRFKATIKFLFGGVVSVGPIDIGPYYNLYSSNRIEGNRFRLGLATNEHLWKDLRLSAYGAYGTLDQQFKYYGEAFWILNRQPRMYVFGSYRSDVDRSNSYYDNQVGPDNIFSGIARKPGVPAKLAYVNDARFEFYKEYYSGFSHMLTFQNRVFNPYEPLPSYGIFKDAEGREHDEVTSTEVGLRLRYAYKEDFLESNYYRTSLGSIYPIVEIRASMGIKGAFNSGYEYQKASISVSDNWRIAPFGTLYYNLFAGQTFGTLPYPLLDIAPGNEFRYYLRSAFNMMNRYEFISDRYAGFNIEHTIGGGIFNYIPYLKKAKFRQFWTAKGIIGSLSPANTALNLNKGYEFRSLQEHPYIEVGTGVENILQVLRLDFVWRVTPAPLPGESRSKYFGIFGSLRFNF
jgi:hypothetical protein